jgi:putative ABC transport system permease protein
LAALVLALGIGANGAMFSLLDVALIRPLPFNHPDRLTMVWEHPPGYARNRVSPLNFLDWSEQNHTFASIAAVAGGDHTMSAADGTAERVRGQSVTASFFNVLGIVPIAGRTFVPDEASLGSSNVVVVSERLWRSRFGSDPSLIGRQVTLDAQPFTVIGIVPAAFQLLAPSDLWTPFRLRRSPEQRAMHFMQVIGRLADGVGIDRARADIEAVAAHIAQVSPETNKDWTVTVEPLHEALVGNELRATSLILAGVVAFVLLIACANVANLLLARGVGRSRELSVRAALGAGRARIVRQLVTESLLLAVMGGTIGIVVSAVVIRVTERLVPPGTLPESVVPVFDWRVTAFTVGLTLATGFLFGLVPAWHGARTSLVGAMAAGGRGSTRGLGRVRVALAIVEVAAAVLLVSGAGLLVRTLMALNDVDPGYHADRVLTMSVGLPITRYPKPEQALMFYRAVEQRVSAIPGVRNVSFGGTLPLDGWNIGQAFSVVGDPSIDPSHQPAAHYQMVGPRYFEVLGIQILKGRAFTDRDTAAVAPVCIINEQLMRRYFKDRDPIGALLSVAAMDPGGPKPVVRQVVGVIRQVKVEGPEKEDVVEIYVPLEQNAWYSATLAVKTDGLPMSFLPAVKAAIAGVDKDQAVTRVRTMDDVASQAVARPRFRAELISIFAALALTLAAVGVFGVLAFDVHQRTRELGIRTALGARPLDLLRLVLRSGLEIAGFGMGIGLVAVAILSRFLRALLFGVAPIDPVTLGATATVLVLTALAACAAPALRAARVDPAVALRHE